MILIADSGSTKTEWRILSPDGTVSQARTTGYNPHHQPAEAIIHSLRTEFMAQLPPEPIEKIFFYGAGCGSDKSKEIVRKAFAEVFPATELVIEHDLLAAARALCLEEPGIACILGTGSNSCLYDGKQITGNVPALGYILGDEGSGTDLGKKVVADYLRGNMPEHLLEKFRKRFDVTVDEVLDRIYRQPFPKPYLASFSRFLFHNLKDPYCYKLVYDSFSDFIRINISQYPGYKQHKVHFVGSIAFYYSNILRQAAADQGLTVRNILESPIAGLTLYHQGEQ
jgi:glucosamine kinase